jgi:hypothetical protein
LTPSIIVFLLYHELLTRIKASMRARALRTSKALIQLRA